VLDAEGWGHHSKRSVVRCVTHIETPELLPPQEIRVAIAELVKQAHGVRREETFTAIARALGFQATSQQLRDVIDQQIDRMISAGDIKQDDGVLVID
jgi:hypothetical protein